METEKIEFFQHNFDFIFIFLSKWEKIPEFKQHTESFNYLKIKLMRWVIKPKLISLFNIFIMTLDMTENE